MEEREGYEAAISQAGEWGRWQWRMVAVMMSPAAVASLATLSWIFTAQAGEGEEQSILSSLELEVEDRRWVGSVLAPVFMVGMLVGAPVLGCLSDRQGRLPSILLSLAVTTTAGSLLPAGPSSLPWHLALRFITGLGAGGVLVGNFVYLVEWSSSASSHYWRFRSALALHLGWNLGQLVLVLVSSLTHHWRLLQLVTHLLGLPVILLVLLTQPESARWLVSAGKIEKAREVLTKISATNEKTISESVLKSLSPPSPHQRGSLTKKLVARLGLTGYLWFAANLCYYGLHFTMASLHGNIHLNFFLLVLAEISANFFTHLVALPYLGRKRSLVVFLLVCSSVLVLNSVIPAGATNLRISLTLAGKFAATANFNSIYFYTCELFPTTVRSTSLGFCSTMGRLGGMTAVFLASSASWMSVYLPPLIISAAPLLSALLCLLLPDTKHTALPDTFHQADNIGST